MEHESIFWMGSDRMLLRYSHCKPITTKFPDKFKWQNPDRKGGLVWNTDGFKTIKGTGARVYRWGSRKAHSFSFGLHTMVFQAETYAAKA
jgi:hypothetical protein